MESREMIMPAVETRAPEAKSSYQMALSTNSTTQTASSSQMMEFSTETPSSLAKKKRKYGPNGVAVSGRTLSPMPLSSASGGYTDGEPAGSGGEFQVEKRKKRKMNSYEKSNLSLGKWPNGAASPGHQFTSGASFTPHIVTVNPGEDVTSKIISCSKYGPRAICVLSALGIISHVTLRQANSSGSSVTYEGRFEILSLSGSFTPREVGGSMSIALSSPDGRVVGGLLGGLLTAAGPVQVVVASFLPDVRNPVGPKPRKPKNIIKLLTPVANPTAPLSTNKEEQQKFNEQSQESPTTENTNSSPAPKFQHENRAPMPSVHDWKRDMHMTLRED